MRRRVRRRVRPRRTQASSCGNVGGRLDAVLPEQRVHIGPPAAKFDERIKRVAAAAAGEDRIEETLRGGAVKYTLLLKCTEGVGSEHLSPLVAVIACGVAAGKHVPEAVCKAIPLWNWGDADGRAHGGQDLGDAPAQRRVVARVQLEVEQREFELSHHLQAGLKAARLNQSRLQLCGQGSASFDVV